MWPWSKGTPQIFGDLFNISAMTAASDFKFGMLLGFGNARDKITRRRKGTHGPGLKVLPKSCMFVLTFYTMAKTVHFKFGTQLGFAKSQHKTTPRGKVGVVLRYESFQVFSVPL